MTKCSTRLPDLDAKVFREKSALSFFDFGLDSYVGNSVFLEAHRQNTVNMSEADFSNGMLRFGELSMAMVLQVLVPLFRAKEVATRIGIMKEGNLESVIRASDISANELEALYLKTV